MIAKKMFPNSDSNLQSVLKFLDHSEKHMELNSYDKQKPGQLPPIKRVDRKIEELRTMYRGSTTRSSTGSIYVDYRTKPPELGRKGGRKKPRKLRATSPLFEEDSPELESQ